MPEMTLIFGRAKLPLSSVHVGGGGSVELLKACIHTYGIVPCILRLRGSTPFKTNYNGNPVPKKPALTPIQSNTQSEKTVDNSAELSRALSSARAGDLILLKGGFNYGNLSLFKPAVNTLVLLRCDLKILAIVQSSTPSPLPKHTI